MTIELLVWETRGGLPDFEDFTLEESVVVGFTADTVERLTEDDEL